jgi:hypothetical protein
VNSRRRALAEEGRHDPGAERWWEECWDFDFVAPDGELGGFVRFALYPNQRRAWCWVYVLRADGTVVVRDHDVPAPTRANLLARSEALWCELVCETPMEHWSIGVEAFGVRLDDAYDGLRGEIGTRLPVGLELEWEAAGHAVAAEEPFGYSHVGRVLGDVLLGDEVIPFEGDGTRLHTWGVRDWWSHPWQHVRCVAAAAVVKATPKLLAVIPIPERDDRAPHDTSTTHVTRALSACTLSDGSEVPGWVELLHIGG